MLTVTATVANRGHQHEISVSTNGQVKTLDIPPKSVGNGSSVNGAELLLVALATCYCNDIYREAAKKGITVRGVTVGFSATFGSEGEPGTNFRYKPVIESDAAPDVIDDLVRHTDDIAEIHRTLRQGVTVTLLDHEDH